ncbi:MAG: metalloregulator ArsR/SmtB family transcription factor [bacterium]|nr:metalloregulator ArsR/SmtB family transcription factor [bacterium]
MEKLDSSKYALHAKILKALAHPTRLFIVDALGKKEHCVCELTQMIGADTSTVSKHLSLLKNAGIVGIEKRGTNVYYTLKIPCALNFLRCSREVMEASLAEQIKAIRKQ